MYVYRQVAPTFTMRENVRITLRRSAELSDSEIEQLKLGHWRLDCPQMQLRNRGNLPRQTYSGPGYVFQPTPGTLAFHLYAQRGQSAIRSEWSDTVRTGETIPEDAYFDLDVTDKQGRRWRSKRLIPTSIDRAGSGRLVIDGELDQISTRAELPRTIQVRGHRVELRAFQRLHLPWNAGTVQRISTAQGRRRSQAFSKNAWKFRCQELDLLVVQEADQVSVEAYSETRRLPPRVEDRLIEALEFITGHAVLCQIVQVRRAYTVETTIRTRRGELPTARWQPPLVQQWLTVPGTNRITSRHHRSLFERFLIHGISCGAGIHSISGQLAAVREASAGRYIDAYALTLSVAVESLLFSDLHVSVVRRPAKREVQSLQEWIQNWNGSEGLKERALGAVSQLRQLRAGDILRALVKKGAVTKKQYDAWQKLRNHSAHRYQLLHGNSDELRELLPQVQVLFYHLIFHATGYKGPYTDYTLPDWPVRQYPAGH